MSDKIKGVTDHSGRLTLFVFWCPGCKDVHHYRVDRSKSEDQTYPVWSFNGDRERPTFTPSLLVNGHGHGRRCHLFLTNGELHFCGDSDHDLAGKVVPCPDWDDERW